MAEERFSRIVRMIGAGGLERLRGACVAVVGLGAVGSYATEALARSGVGHLRLVDFDEVRASNINRQLYALHSTIGQPKVDVALARVKDINPDCDVQIMRSFAHLETMEQILARPLDLVIDAIDSLTPKVELLAAVSERQIPVISSMGAALRRDPSLVRVGTLDEVHHCPLAAKVRKRLRRRGVSTDLCCVFSTEPVHDLPETAVDRSPSAGGESYRRGRVRALMGSLPTLTGIFGLTAANKAMQMLIESSR